MCARKAPATWFSMEWNTGNYEYSVLTSGYQRRLWRWTGWARMKNDSLYYVAAAALSVAWLITPVRTHAARNGFNINININGDAETCADLKVRSSGGQIAQANE